MTVTSLTANTCFLHYDSRGADRTQQQTLVI